MNAILASELPAVDATRARMTAAYCRDETLAMDELLAIAALPPTERDLVLARAADLVARVRAKAGQQSAVESFMRQYDLSSEEGVLLMCVAEALLRIPDKDTADKLIADKLGEADWEKHLGKSDSVLVNAGTWGLMLTGKFINLGEDTRRNFAGALKRLVGRSGEPVIRLAVRQAMRIMGHQFVMGRTIKEALDRANEKDNRIYRHSYDMLGEAALTQPDAERYMQAYRDAIAALGARGPFNDVLDAPSISIKLSALHPRYEVAKRARVHAELTAMLLELAQLAKRNGICLTVDAEEADRLELSLDVIAAVHADASLDGYQGFGLAVQAYLKRAPFVMDWLAEAAKKVGRRFCVRLVKGAYWDSEIKRAQEGGHAGYPVYTRKPNTDVSYLACAKKMFDCGDAFYPAFATHNAHTIAAIHHMARGRPFEFQRLHGMGTDLYAEVMGEKNLNVPCRVYAPVGSHEDLLPYLVRRLLENGANTSFVNRIVDESLPIGELVADPVDVVRAYPSKAHPRIPQPINLYEAADSSSNFCVLAELVIHIPEEFHGREFRQRQRTAYAGRSGRASLDEGLGGGTAGARRQVRRSAAGRDQSRRPAREDRHQAAGRPGHDSPCARQCAAAQPDWDALPAASRASILENAADLLEAAPCAIHRAVRARSRQDASPPRCPKCAKPPTCAAITQASRAS